MSQSRQDSDRASDVIDQLVDPLEMNGLRHLLAGCAAAGLVLASSSALAQLRSADPAVPVALPSTASTVVVDLAGWEAWGGFGNPQNTEVRFNIGAGSAVLGFQWTNLVFTAEGASWIGEFVLSVNDSAGDQFMDVVPGDGIDSSGAFGPSSGSWGVDGFSFGVPFTVADGGLWVTVYDSFNDSGRDALVTGGTLTIFYAPIPEPGTYGLMALGLLGVAAAARRRRG
jgi:hypothetical protein